MSAPILLRGGTDAQRLTALGAGAIEAREPHTTTDHKEFFVGEELIYGHTFETLGVAEPASNLTITFAANRRQYLGIVTAADGSGTYTDKIILPTTGRRAGDLAEFKVSMPASADPTIEFRNATSGGTLLRTISPDATTARVYLSRYYFDGSAWGHLETRQQL